MNWQQFIEKLTKAKAEGRIKGNIASVFMNIIYSGAMNSILPEGLKPCLKTYDFMFEELKKALKSKASKPKKKKNEFLGLADVKTDVLLGLWRYQNNPMSQFLLKKYALQSPALSTYVPNPKDIRGFCFQEHTAVSEKDRYAREVTHVTDNWMQFFENPILRRVFVERNGEVELNVDGKKIIEKHQLAILGAVIDKRISMTRTGKQRMAVTLFTGKEKTHDIIFWPPRDKDYLSSNLIEGIKPLNVYAIFVNLKEYMETPTANAVNNPPYIKVFDFYADKTLGG